MTPERWRQVEEVLQGALDCAAAERASYLDQACRGDEELKFEATTLIRAHDAAGAFIEEPAIAADAHLLLGASIGRAVGPYKIIECLGSGGMGEVYLAQDTRLDRPVALKILPAYFAADDARLRRFQREARAASALNHPNILTIHEVGEHDEVRFIATEYIDGPTLRELIERNELSIAETIDIITQVASALSAAHSAGIIHRDIKPENIMRRADGLVKILDFGIAKLVEQESFSTSSDTQSSAILLTEVGVVMGTVNYMSPEQARALDVDERTDIWSLGVVLYEMLERRLPFAGDTRMDTLVSILEREPKQIDPTTGPTHGALRGIVRKALCKERDDRYQNADELLRDLKSVEETGTVQMTSGALNPTKPSVFRNRVTWMALAALTLALITGFVLLKGRLSPSQIASQPSVAKPYSQMNDAEQMAFVSEQEQRISTMMGDRHVTLNEDAIRTIKRHVDHFVGRNGSDGVPHEETLSGLYGRAQQHVPLIARAFAARKVPVIIGIYLPVIESAYRECQESPNGAKGLFQFLPQTAQQYGVSPDEMCDVEKMAPAAAHYIADRMAELGEDSQSLTLVLLSYNRGPESVRNSLRELRETENYQRNFWTLFAHRDKLDERFRQESADYVPAFFAAAIIGENPQVFGLAMPPLSRSGQSSEQ